MFDKFGEFDSAEEINRAAAAQLAEGDHEAIRGIAAENGLDPEDAEDYITGDLPELCNVKLAALGKLKVETEDLKPAEIMEDWCGYIRQRAVEDPDVAAAVRKKGKSLKGCVSVLLSWSFRNAKEVDKDIVKEAAKTCKEINTEGHGRAWLGIPGMGTAKKLITDYYLGGAR